jgi:hypothetical protein
MVVPDSTYTVVKGLRRLTSVLTHPVALSIRNDFAKVMLNRADSGLLQDSRELKI